MQSSSQQAFNRIYNRLASIPRSAGTVSVHNTADFDAMDSVDDEELYNLGQNYGGEGRRYIWLKWQNNRRNFGDKMHQGRKRGPVRIKLGKESEALFCLWSEPFGGQKHRR